MRLTPDKRRDRASLLHERSALHISNLATRDDMANLATRQDMAVLIGRIDGVIRDLAVIKSDLRTVKWIVAGIGFGMLTVMLGVSSLVTRIFGLL